MKARDIMTREVVTVSPKTPVQQVALLLAGHRISGIPVIADGKRLLGIVSEGDLLERAELGAEPKGKWWLDAFADAGKIASRYAKAHGATAADVMTRQVAVVPPEASVSEVANVLQAHHVKRVPVVQDGTLVGIVTRSDIVRAVSGAMAPVGGKGHADSEQQRAILERMRTERWLDTSYVNVAVAKGKATVSGLIGSADERRALGALVGQVVGPENVVDRLEIGLPLVTEF